MLFRIRAAAPPGRVAAMKGISIRFVQGERPGPEQWILAGETERDVALTLTAGSDGPARIAWGVGAGPGTVAIGDVSLRPGCEEVFSRRFEHGLVLLNGSGRTPARFDPDAIGGGTRYRRLRGKQCPEVNTGEPAGPAVTVPPRDGLFLMRVDSEARAGQ